MNKENNSNGMNRRQFLQTSAQCAASAMFLGLGGAPSFAAPNAGARKNVVPLVTLNNGLQMPLLGLGTMTLTGDLGTRCVAEAIAQGYRLIDTATIYNSETAVGAGIKQSGVKREEIFITSKLWKTDMGYEQAKKGFQTSLDKLGTDYLDLYLIHRPAGDVKGSWKAMEELFHQGKIKAIGVSNFEPARLADLIASSDVKPAINQIETHAFFQEGKAYDYLKQHGIQHEAWAPFAEGRHGLFTNATLAAIGKKYNKTVAQVCLRWHFQRGIIAIPRSSQKAHIAENVNIFDFNLEDSDMASISTLDLNTTQFPEWS
ncbi:MAG: aldo/keto reductase [Verrucomicrobiales bacterium]|nr:aldo/keto reductase [Verrucomicrobiales bacterium]